ncbi:hypothetical protein BGW38_006169, partial [Lunasporangiospora selenospora]
AVQKYAGYRSATHSDISMHTEGDDDEAAHVGLLGPEQFDLSPSPRMDAVTSTNGPYRSRPPRPNLRGGREDEEDDEDSDNRPLVRPQDHSSDETETTDSFPVNGPYDPQATPYPQPYLQSPHRQPHTAVRIHDDYNRVGVYGNVLHPEENGNQNRARTSPGDRYGFSRGDEEQTVYSSPVGLPASRFTVKRDGRMRYCQKCNHCPWLNNCVGHKNHKAFYLFVFWTAVYCVFIAVSTIAATTLAINLPSFDPQWIFVILGTIVFGLCLVPFAIHHTLLLKSNKTSLESFEKHRYRVGSTGEVLQSRVLNVFDLGASKNFRQVLGPVWYLWLVPVRNSTGSGWTFPANDYGKNMLQLDEEIESHPPYPPRNTHMAGVHPSRDNHLQRFGAAQSPIHGSNNPYSSNTNPTGRKTLSGEELGAQGAGYYYANGNNYYDSNTRGEAGTGLNGYEDEDSPWSAWSPRNTPSPLPQQLQSQHQQQLQQQQQGQLYNNGTGFFESYDLQDTVDLEDHVRRDSDESLNESDATSASLGGGGGGEGNGGRSFRRSFRSPTPRRFRRQADSNIFPPPVRSSFGSDIEGDGIGIGGFGDDEGGDVEEYLYDSDEPATIRIDK